MPVVSQISKVAYYRKITVPIPVYFERKLESLNTSESPLAVDNLVIPPTQSSPRPGIYILGPR
jgi:hypothetical protein